jgi:hypothetical protein
MALGGFNFLQSSGDGRKRSRGFELYPIVGKIPFATIFLKTRFEN